MAIQQPQRVQAMAAEWFRLASDVDRLKGRGLAPVTKNLKSLEFRRDTRSGSAKPKTQRPRKKQKNKKS